MCKAKRKTFGNVVLFCCNKSKREVEYDCCHFAIYCTFNKESNVNTVECLGVENNKLL